MRSAWSRRVGVAGLAGLVLLGAAYGLTLEPAPRIRVRWRDGIVAGQQAEREAAYSLRNARDRFPEGSLAYDLLDTSRSNIRRLVQDPAVADTNDIDRDAFRVEPGTDRGGERMWIASRVPGLRNQGIRQALLLLLATAAGVGLRREWLWLLRTVVRTAARAVRAWNTHWREHHGARAVVEAIPAIGWRGTSVLMFGGGIAAVVVLVGTRDLESFETAFFSLNRESTAAAVQVFGQPVFTTAVGLGVRLPLHGNLGASPAAVLAPYLPAPFIYWLLIAFSIAGSALVVRHALEPIAGLVAARLSVVLLFCSVPIVNYTIYDDWPETAVTFCAFVACVFAPHALLSSLASRGSPGVRRMAVPGIAAIVWSLIALAHPGYWPLLAVTLVLASVLALWQPHDSLARAFTAIAVLGLASAVPVALQGPDVLRELTIGAAVDGPPMTRFVQGPLGSLVPANAFPFVAAAPRQPFTFLPLAAVSFIIGLLSDDRQLRRLAVGGALVSLALGTAATRLMPLGTAYAPTATWALRDPAIAFAVLSGAAALASVNRSPGFVAIVGARLAAGALLVTALQGVAYAGNLVLVEVLTRGHREPWMQNMRSGGERVRMRGLSPDRLPTGQRLALWPGVRTQMREQRRASTDFADAGYSLVTAWTKARTMRGVIEPNSELFNQATDLPARVLCNPNVVRFLQLRFLVAPPHVECGPWKRLPDSQIDGWLEVAVATPPDDRAWALPESELTVPAARRPAFSGDSPLLDGLVPLAGTSVTLTASGVAIRLDDPTRARGYAVVLPLAFDSAHVTSSGQLHNVGGLAAVREIDRREVTVRFVPDLVALLHAVSLTLAQCLAIGGFVGLARVSWRGV